VHVLSSLMWVVRRNNERADTARQSYKLSSSCSCVVSRRVLCYAPDEGLELHCLLRQLETAKSALFSWLLWSSAVEIAFSRAVYWSYQTALDFVSLPFALRMLRRWRVFPNFRSVIHVLQ
jgi:hypothetical protein